MKISEPSNTYDFNLRDEYRLIYFCGLDGATKEQEGSQEFPAPTIKPRKKNIATTFAPMCVHEQSPI